MSAPASLAASRESLAEGRAGTPVEQYKRYSADLTRLSEGDILTQGSNGSGSSSGSHKGTPRVCVVKTYNLRPGCTQITYI